jgi:hypothetical protein
MSLPRMATFVISTLVVLATSVAAQPLGTFRWQLQPYCNVFEINVTQQGGIYTLDGVDDRCGGGNQAGSVVGTAYLTPLGLVGFGITTVLPNGTPIHTEATINISSLNGTWRDSAGNNGTFVFTPGPGTGGSLRPVPSGGVAANSITAVQIAPAAVGATELATNSVTGANIVDGSITTADLLDAPRLAFSSGDQILPLTGTAAIARSVSINAPVAGTVIVNASASLQFTGAGTTDSVQCSITTGNGIDITHQTNASEGSTTDANYAPYAATRGFTVPAGITTVNLVCRAFLGTAELRDSSMTAIFVAAP